MELRASLPIALPIAPRQTSVAASRMRRAHQAVVNRKPMSAQDLDELATQRYRDHLRRTQPRRWGLTGLVVTLSVLACVYAALRDSVALLVAGVVLAMAAVALVVHTVVRMKPSHDAAAAFHKPGERVASAGETSILCYLASKDPEIKRLIASWWDCCQPIRLQDIELVMEFCDAKRMHGGQTLATFNQPLAGNRRRPTQPQSGCPCADGECPAWSPVGPAATAPPVRCAAAPGNRPAPALRR